MKQIIPKVFDFLNKKLLKCSRNLILFSVLLLTISIFISPINSSKVKLEKITQINYRDQLEQCQKDYEKMYGMLNSKVKDYADNEVKLLNNVRNTILSTFDKSEKAKSLIETKLRKCFEREAALKAATEETVKFYKDLNDKIKKEIDSLKAEMEKLNKEKLQCKMDLENSVKERSYLENEKQKIESEYNNYKAEFGDTSSKLKTRLKECNEKLTHVEMRKNMELKDKRIENSNVDSQIKHLEKAIEKTKTEGKHSLNNHLFKSEKLKENLNLIDDKIKNIIEMLPGLENYDTNKVKKELKDIKSNLHDLGLENEKISNLIQKEKEREENYNKKIKKEETQDENNKDKSNGKIEKDLLNSDESVFLETKNKSLSKLREIRIIKNTNELSKVNKEENLLKNKIDHVLFENIDQSRLIYKKIQLFGQLIIDAVEQNKICQNKLEDLNTQNVNLKTALAVTEVNNRIKK